MVKRLCLFGAIFGFFGYFGECGDFGEKPHYPHYPLCPHSPLYKPSREAHHTFQFSPFRFQFNTIRQHAYIYNLLW